MLAVLPALQEAKAASRSMETTQGEGLAQISTPGAGGVTRKGRGLCGAKCLFLWLKSLKGRIFRLGAGITIASAVPSQGLSVVWGEGREKSENRVVKTIKHGVS